MGRHDWYRNEVWNEEIEEFFEVKYKRARRPDCKAQYLCLQACYLLENKDAKVQNAGLRMMERLFKEHPTALSEHINAWCNMGEYYMRVKDYSSAEIYFQKVIKSCRTHKQYVGSVGLSDLKIIDIILMTNQKKRFEEAYVLLQGFPKAFRRGTFFNNVLFYFYDLGARLCFAMNKLSEAKQWANQAIELVQIKEPQLPRHPTVGLVEASKKQINVLKQIAEKEKL